MLYRVVHPKQEKHDLIQGTCSVEANVKWPESGRYNKTRKANENFQAFKTKLTMKVKAVRMHRLLIEGTVSTTQSPSNVDFNKPWRVDKSWALRRSKAVFSQNRENCEDGT